MISLYPSFSNLIIGMPGDDRCSKFETARDCSFQIEHKYTFQTPSLWYNYNYNVLVKVTDGLYN